MRSIPQSAQVSAYEAKQAALAELGQNLPVVLIKALQENLFLKALDWLKANGAPEEVWQAFEIADVLQLSIQYIQAGALDDSSAADLTDNLVKASQLAVKFGGMFLDRWVVEGESQVPAWQGKPKNAPQR